MAGRAAVRSVSRADRRCFSNASPRPWGKGGPETDEDYTEDYRGAPPWAGRCGW